MHSPHAPQYDGCSQSEHCDRSKYCRNQFNHVNQGFRVRLCRSEHSRELREIALVAEVSRAAFYVELAGGCHVPLAMLHLQTSENYNSISIYCWFSGQHKNHFFGRISIFHKTCGAWYNIYCFIGCLLLQASDQQCGFGCLPSFFLRHSTSRDPSISNIRLQIFQFIKTSM